MPIRSEVNLRTEKGITKLTFIVFAALIGAAIYSGYRVLPFYYYYYELRNQFEAATRIASTETDAEIRKKLNYHIRKMDLPVGSDEELRESLHIERDGDRMKISLKYEEVFDIDFQGKNYVIKRFPFHAYVEGKF